MPAQFGLFRRCGLKLLDSSFSSTLALAQLFEPLSPDLAVLQLSVGKLEGRLRIYSLGAFRLSLLESSQALFLSGQRNPERITMALELSSQVDPSNHRAQGGMRPGHSLMGFNLKLQDFDLQLPAGTKLCSLLFPREMLLGHLRRKACHLALERLEHSNVLELSDELTAQFLPLLHSITTQADGGLQPDSADRLLELVLSCFSDQRAEIFPVAFREDRHQAALALLHHSFKRPEEVQSVKQLCEILHYSRSSLFKGCQEHFGITPLVLQRSVRLDRVRSLLIDPLLRAREGLEGVTDVAKRLGFTSRSHFARHYRKRFLELPAETLRGSGSAGINLT